jgi:hypothetical protein
MMDAVSEISLAGIGGFRYRVALVAVAEHPAFRRDVEPKYLQLKYLRRADVTTLESTMTR